jgi:hypothetical protein
MSLYNNSFYQFYSELEAKVARKRSVGMWLIDLRTNLTKTAVKIKPSDSKEKDFHLALADYLHKELKSNGLSVNRHNVMLKVSLQNKHLDKYEHLIIDCLDGKMYLRGKEVKDKYFGRLRRFQGGQRPADAFHCVTQSATRIINRIQKLQQSLNGEERQVFGGTIEREDLRKAHRQDLRSITTKLDLRKTAQLIRQDCRTHTKVIVSDLRKVNRLDCRKITIAKNIIADFRKNAKIINKTLEEAQPAQNQISSLVDQLTNQLNQIDTTMLKNAGIDKGSLLNNLKAFDNFANFVLQNVATKTLERQDMRSKIASRIDLRGGIKYE